MIAAQPPEGTGIEPVTDPRAITFLSSTTTTRTDRTAEDGTRTAVDHVARFGIEPGTVPDLPHKYGSQMFRPSFLVVSWHDGQVYSVTVTGPRVLASGKTADMGVHNHNANTREFKWTGYDIRKNSGYDGHTVAPVILDRIRRYETDVAGFNHGSTLVFGGGK